MTLTRMLAVVLAASTGMAATAQQTDNMVRDDPELIGALYDADWIFRVYCDTGDAGSCQQRDVMIGLLVGFDRMGRGCKNNFAESCAAYQTWRDRTIHDHATLMAATTRTDWDALRVDLTRAEGADRQYAVLVQGYIDAFRANGQYCDAVEYPLCGERRPNGYGE